MAGEQPLEQRSSPPAPGAFPETPAPETENQIAFSVNPIPASDGPGNPIQLAPGEKVPDSSTINSNSVESGVREDPELKSKADESEQTMSVNPIPATSGLGNPVQLAPGEKVPDPSSLTSNTVDSTVRSGDGDGAGSTLPVSQSEPSASGLGPQTGSQIPESSMGMGSDAPSDINKEDTGPTISSVAPTSTTNQLAGQVPKEERREPTVIDDANDSTDPTINSVAPSSTTNQLAGSVPKEDRREPTVTDDTKDSADPTINSVAPSSTTNQLAGSVPKEDRREAAVIGESKENAAPDSEKSGGLWNKGLMGGAAAAGATVAGGAYAANEALKDRTGTDPKSSLPESAQKAVDDNATSSAPQTQSVTSPSDDTSLPQQTAAGEAPKVLSEEPRETAAGVPEEVATSQKEAQFPPEASASTEAVKEKSAVEDELLQKVPESDAKGEPAPTESAALASTAPGATASDNTTSATGAPQLGDPTAGVAALSMDEKPTGSKPEVTTGVATTDAPAESKPEEAKAEDKPLDSRDVSPMSRPATHQTQPEVTTGTGTSKAPEETKPTPRPQKEGASTTPQKRQSFIDRMKGTPDSTASGSSDAKKDKRRSLFGRIKDKLKS